MLGCSEGNLRNDFFIIFTRYFAIRSIIISLIFGKVLVLVGLIASVISFFVISAFTYELEIRLDIVFEEEDEDEPRRGLSFF